MSDILSKIKELPLESKKKLKEIMPSLQSNVFDKLLMDQIDSMNDEEYNVFLELLVEAAEGSSQLHDDLVMEDYDELPIDISTFISDPEYLGASTGNGSNIYPYWKSTLARIFANDSTIVEVILSGAIGIGKSTVALIALAYILHRLLCLRTPAKHYNLLEGSKIAIALFNISLDQVYGIGYDKLQSLLKLSPWFLHNGTLSGRNANKVKALLEEGKSVPPSLVADLTYYPGKDIHIIVGSQESHFTGYDVFCMSGDTEILTTNGYSKLEDLDGKFVDLVSQDSDYNPVVSHNTLVAFTKNTNELIELELEDRSVIECTSDHLLRLSNGEYIKACELKVDDDIMEIKYDRNL